jgi:hypothetical protein
VNQPAKCLFAHKIQNQTLPNFSENVNWNRVTALVGVRANEKNHQSSLIKIEHVGADANMSESFAVGI